MKDTLRRGHQAWALRLGRPDRLRLSPFVDLSSPSLVGLTALLLALAANHTTAETWQLLPSANLQIGYDDNPQSASNEAEGSFLSTLNASLRALRSSDASDLGFGLGFTANTYLDAANLDNTSWYANSDLQYRSERHRFGLGLGFITQSTLYRQGPPSRLNQVNQQQQTLTVSPSWGFQVSERSTLDLAVSLQDVTFEDEGLVVSEDGIPVSVTNYRSGSVNLGIGHTLTERLALTGTLGYSRYVPQGISNESENFQLMAGASYQLSEISGVAAQAGVRFTEQTVEGPLDGRTLTQESSAPSFNLSYFKRFEAGGGFGLAASRTISPTGEGDVVDNTGLSASLSLQPRPKWQIGVTASANRSRSPSGETVRGDETSYSIGPSLSYRITEVWGLSLGYLFSYQDLSDTGGDAVSNAVYLNLSWTPRPWDL